MSSSDQSDDGIYVSDEEITSFLHPRNSSSDEALDKKEEHKCIGRARGPKDLKRSLNCSTTLQSPPTVASVIEPAPICSKMFEFGNDVPQVPFTSHIKLRLMDLVKQTGAAAYLSPSFMRDWNISLEVPPKVICDACIFSDTMPVCLFTFHQGGEADEILRYNAKVTRHFVSKVRKVSHFTALNGVFDEADCNTEESVMMKMHNLESEARKKFVPNWLHMDGARRSQIVEIFLKMGLKCGKQWFEVSDSLNERTKSVTLTSKETYPSDTKTMENGFAGHQVNGNEETVTSTTNNFDKNTMENEFAGYHVDCTALDVESSNKRINMSSNPEIEDNLTITLEILETRKLKESRRKDLETSTKLCLMSPMLHV